jgi:hypothetical protein
MEITTMAPVGTGKTLPKGILIQNVISKMRLLWSATTTSLAIVDGGMSDINNHSPPNIQLEGRTIIQKHPRKNTMSPQQNVIAGKTFLSDKVEEDRDDQYTQPEEIYSDVQNSNLLLTSDHEYNNPYERPSWG